MKKKLMMLAVMAVATMPLMAATNPVLVLRSRPYFLDVETMSMLNMLILLNCGEAKERIDGAVRNLVFRPF